MNPAALPISAVPCSSICGSIRQSAFFKLRFAVGENSLFRQRLPHMRTLACEVCPL